MTITALFAGVALGCTSGSESSSTTVARTYWTPEKNYPDPEISIRMSVGMTRATEYLAARTYILEYPGQQVIAEIVDGESSCSVEDGMVRALDQGMCTIGIKVADRPRSVTVQVLSAPERTSEDRPGGNVLDLKPVYIRFADSPDEQRDVNGQIASYVQGFSDFLAIQYPGYALRVDTSNGVPDVQHIELPLTIAEFLDRWSSITDSSGPAIGPLGPILEEYGISAGYESFYASETGTDRIQDVTRILVGIVESPGGELRDKYAYTDGGCRGSKGNPFIAFFIRGLSGSACPVDLEFNGSASGWYGYDAFRLMLNHLNGNRGCDSIIEAKGAIDIDLDRNSLASPHDPIRYEYLEQAYPRILDPNRSLYFQISSGEFVGDPCTDLIYSPYLTEWFNGDIDNDQVVGRVTEDQPDDFDGPQVRVLYVLPQDGPDRQWDTNGLLHAAAASANDWLHANGGRNIRFDTFEGMLDVGFVRLAVPESTLWLRPDGSKCATDEMCPDPRRIVDILEGQGHLTPGKIHTIVWGAQLAPTSANTAGCAGAMPDRNAVFLSPLLRRPLTGRMDCTPAFVAYVPDSGNTLGLVMIHEIFHVLGAVGEGAPDADNSYHIENDPSDLMGGSAGIVRLDLNRRNYWDHTSSGVVDVTDSQYLTTTSSSMKKPYVSEPNRPWWMDPPIYWSPLQGLGVEPTAGSGSGGDYGLSKNSICTTTSTEIAITIAGKLESGSGIRATSKGDVSNQSVGLFKNTPTGELCLIGTAITDEFGRYSFDVPTDLYKKAASNDGGSYCVAWDQKKDGLFGNANEPINCRFDLPKVKIIIDVRG